MLRNCREDEINRKTRRARKAAFIPRLNGKDDDGLSLSQPNNDCEEALRLRMENAGGQFLSTMAGFVRGISENAATLDVCPKPTEVDVWHAVILGFPSSAEQKSDPEKRALAIRLASKLADQARPFTPPC